MDSPNRNAKTMIGIQKVIAPVAGMLKMAWDPWPFCQNHTMNPNVAVSDSRLSTTALTASTAERNANVSSTMVSRAISPNISGNRP